MWERYTVRFSIYYPLENTEDENMQIHGGGSRGWCWNQDRSPNMMAMASDKDTVWLNGSKVRPWEWQVTYDQTTCPKEVCYKYSIKN